MKAPEPDAERGGASFDGGGYLTLFSPLFYRPRPAGFDDAFTPRGAETLLRFDIVPSEALSIEPAGAYLERLAEAGTAAGGGMDSRQMTKCRVVLPAGLYWFSQIRDRLDRDAFIEMAKEAQKEALWQRAKLGASVYFRTLREDGAPVSQVFRPVLKSAGFQSRSVSIM